MILEILKMSLAQLISDQQKKYLDAHSWVTIFPGWLVYAYLFF